MVSSHKTSNQNVRNSSKNAVSKKIYSDKNPKNSNSLEKEGKTNVGTKANKLSVKL